MCPYLLKVTTLWTKIFIKIIKLKYGPYFGLPFQKFAWGDLILSVAMSVLTIFWAYRVAVDFHIICGFIALCYGTFIKVGLKVANLDWHWSLRASKVKRIRKNEKRQSYISIDNLPLSPYRIALDNPLLVMVVFSFTHAPLLFISYFFPTRHFFWIFYIGFVYILYVFYNTPPTRIHIKTPPYYKRKWLIIKNPKMVLIFWYQIPVLKVLWLMFLLYAVFTFYTYLIAAGLVISKFTPFQFLFASSSAMFLAKLILLANLSRPT